MITKIEINTTTPRYNVSFGEGKGNVYMPQTCPGGNRRQPPTNTNTTLASLFPDGRGKNFWQKLLEALNKMTGSLFKDLFKKIFKF